MILNSDKKNTLPKIEYDEINGVINISGRSISTEADVYFNLFLPYLSDNLQKVPIDIDVTIDLEYFNTNTSIKLMEFFNIINENVVYKGHTVKVTWFIDKIDEDIKESAQDFEELSKIKFQYIEK